MRAHYVIRRSGYTKEDDIVKPAKNIPLHFRESYWRGTHKKQPTEIRKNKNADPTPVELDKKDRRAVLKEAVVELRLMFLR